MYHAYFFTITETFLRLIIENKEYCVYNKIRLMILTVYSDNTIIINRYQIGLKGKLQ